ncbi:uroporphyrinogen decarboxylase family protein [Candidatus Hydrogenedentota bacterium]
MTPRERTIKAITFDGPDRVPIRHGLWPGTRQKYGEALDKIVGWAPGDIRAAAFQTPKNMISDKAPKVFRDMWGAEWTVSTGEWQPHPTGAALADWVDLERYTLPEADACDWETVRQDIAQNEGQMYLIGQGGNLFETLQNIRGFENALMDVIIQPPELVELLDGIVDFNLRVVERWTELDVDGINFGDDWGSQQQLLIRPDQWREIFRPRYKKLFDAVKSSGKYLHFHSDGCITEIIPDLVELGVDVVNIQLPIMDMEQLGEMLKGKVCVRGGADRQEILPFGSTEKVREHVFRIYETFGSASGGWIGNAGIGPDTSLENIEAFYRAILECM